jgi:TatD DNase family protein
VGEIGLDRSTEERDQALQEQVFRAQLALARRHARPVTVHCLRAWGWLLEVLRGEPPLPAGMVVHAYGGATELLAPLARLGASFSFACNVLRPHTRRARAAAAAVPSGLLLVETDAPDIPPPATAGLPGPHLPDGRLRTEPAFAAAVLRGIAELRQVPADELAAAVMANACRLFGPLAGAAAPAAAMAGRAEGR